MVNLKAGKIYLRPIELKDVNSNYLSWLHDREVMQGIATSGYTLENLKVYVEERLNKQDVAFFAICSKDTNEHIGNIKIDFHDKQANVSELGLLIGNKNYWGKGVGYEACRLAMDYGFNTMGIRKLYLAVYENNLNAKKLYEKLGFKLEGTLRKHVMADGHLYHKYLMGIFKEEFK
ncbi:MAG: GNAT family N-acetyltransferase [Bacteroidia bacterium]|nr:GNAT family N-acetyltransferase [Bacteroidia bacterium]